MLELPVDLTSTLHYDTTQRNKIDGEWVSVILRLSNGVQFDLRPLTMAFEDRENIIRFVVETYKRIASAVSIILKNTVVPTIIWEKTTFVSTDAVSKNHYIGEGVAEKLGCSHVQVHVLCKSHTAGEGVDTELIKVLIKRVELPLKLRTHLECVNPALRMFFRHTSVVQACLRALTKLVTPDKSANSCSLSSEFEELSKELGMSRKLVLCDEKRLGRVGSCASAILESLPILERLVDQSPADNMLA